MTAWQWRVLIALVRYVLRKDNIDITSIYSSDRISEDEEILIEAVIRNES